MKNISSGAALYLGLTALAVALGAVTPVLSHHSFAMYDQSKTVTFTGVSIRFVPQANHAELHFVPLGADGQPVRGDDGRPVPWGVEMAGAAAVAGEGITAANFPNGTIFSVSLNPLRDGRNFGSRTGPIVRCPKDTPPPAGKHCDAVEGSTRHGTGTFAAAQE
jgi:hypothetical protein